MLSLLVEDMETIINKSTEIEHPVLAEIKERRSKRAYSTTPVKEETIRSLFEAARWAPSSMNEQPWVYIYAVADNKELWNKIFASLNDSNKIWAQHAPLLVVSLARKTLLRNGVLNGAAKYDVGAANALLSLQATHAGLNVHQMGGYNKQVLIDNLNIPETHEPTVVMAIGYPGDPESLPENLKTREVAPRERYTQDFFVITNPF
ncbi:MAG TPA: nitroreductase family protein [Cyclobacteriaceae bacterium]|nr:nitroreductase family protein [Cyclobacteriaceae bacterium]